MNQSSPTATGTAGAAIACLVAVIASLNNRFGLGLNAQDQVSISTGIVVSAHWLVQQYTSRRAANPATAQPAASVAPLVAQPKETA
ncbi:hypothetical protein AAGS40_23140 [Paraburkholderia sp. PREW-6R]|uniref:hypothetical protein n=1 Tax=Paraburkholderia sp. PREW-6R TaxID=3141544 RepID=UPI0031F5D646